MIDGDLILQPEALANNAYKLVILVRRFLRSGSVVVDMIVTLSSQFSDSPTKLVEEINEAESLAGYHIERKFTKAKGDGFYPVFVYIINFL